MRNAIIRVLDFIPISPYPSHTPLNEGDYPGLDSWRRRFYRWVRQAGAALVFSICLVGPCWGDLGRVKPDFRHEARLADFDIAGLLSVDGAADDVRFLVSFFSDLRFFDLGQVTVSTHVDFGQRGTGKQRTTSLKSEFDSQQTVLLSRRDQTRILSIPQIVAPKLCWHRNPKPFVGVSPIFERLLKANGIASFVNGFSVWRAYPRALRGKETIRSVCGLRWQPAGWRQEHRRRSKPHRSRRQQQLCCRGYKRTNKRTLFSGGTYCWHRPVHFRHYQGPVFFAIIGLIYSFAVFLFLLFILSPAAPWPNN